MKAEILSATDLTILPEISVLIFVGVFLGAIYRAYRPSAKTAYDHLARLALDDGCIHRHEDPTSKPQAFESTTQGASSSWPM